MCAPRSAQALRRAQATRLRYSQAGRPPAWADCGPSAFQFTRTGAGPGPALALDRAGEGGEGGGAAIVRCIIAAQARLASRRPSVGLGPEAGELTNSSEPELGGQISIKFESSSASARRRLPSLAWELERSFARSARLAASETS